jgi:hypothetical protein
MTPHLCMWATAIAKRNRTCAIIILEVSPLAHEAGYYTMEPGSSVSFPRCGQAQLPEVLCGLRGDVRFQLHRYAPKLGSIAITAQVDIKINNRVILKIKRSFTYRCEPRTGREPLFEQVNSQRA